MGKSSAPPPLIFLSPPTPTNLHSQSFNLDSKISPSILLIIIILAIIFFVSGLLHLLVRCLLRSTQRDPDEVDNDVTALQGQLQQLFHLHDAGVDQSYIDTLPVFPYKAIIGVKDPFDCAVCLSEFEPHDKLRLLPKCSHAFHIDCIDTWLLSHSTCPLCRSSLLTENGYRNPIPIVCVLESGGGESSREIEESMVESDSHTGIRFHREVELESASEVEDGKNVTVKLGKFRNENSDNNRNSSNKLGSRRCYSMGAFAYVLDEGTSLQVPVKTLMKKQSSKKYRGAMSEYGCDSRREFNGIEAFRSIEIHTHGNGNEGGKRESFSVSKIWQRNKKGNDCSSRRTISEIEIEGSELGGEYEETQSCYSVDSLANPASSTSHRRTLLWLLGRQNKVVHNHSSSISSNV